MAEELDMGPSLQLVGARFFNFLLSKLSLEFKLRRMLILQDFLGQYFHTIQLKIHQ